MKRRKHRAVYQEPVQQVFGMAVGYEVTGPIVITTGQKLYE